MTDKNRAFIKLLVDNNVPLKLADKTKRIIASKSELANLLADPIQSVKDKQHAIEKYFPEEVRPFITELCRSGNFERAAEILNEYSEICIMRQGVVKAVVRYVTPLTHSQQEDMENFIRDRFNTSRVNIEYRRDPDIMGGFILSVGDFEYDKSYRTSLRLIKENLKNKTSEAPPATDENDFKGFGNGPEDIISVLKTEIEDFDRRSASMTETGYITRLGDGIAFVKGMNRVMYGELVEFETGTRGIVQNIEKEVCGIVLLGTDYGLTEGSSVIRTKKRAGVGVGDGLLGRVVDALGSPIDGLGNIETEDYFPIEKEAPGVIERKPVTEPLQTGILAIDSMFPIGRGQRELIIGDRQTGKTSIAVDTMINQKGKDVICIYVAIGQKSSTVAKVVNTLKSHGAMEYSIVVAASASEPAPFQYIAPYSGTAMAEFFMSKGKDVLIIYDDLSKHAVAYRAMSLLLHRPPGREAYPGDVFYLHSRLLERSSRLDDEHGGGSLTALPIIETLAGDVSAYIPTNVISITDGQIFLESELFFSGVRPAVNVGLSVSRVGGAAQTKIMKKVSGTLRIDLAQFREMEIFTQFSSDLDNATTEMLNHGRKLIELLKQPLYNPLPHHEQVMLLYAASHGFMKSIAVKEVALFKKNLMEYMRAQASDVLRDIDSRKALDDELEERIKLALENFTFENDDE